MQRAIQLCLLAAVCLGAARPQAQVHEHRGCDPLPPGLFTASFVLDQGEAIELSAEQGRKIELLVEEARVSAEKAQPEFAAMCDTVRALFEPPRVEEQTALELIDTVLDLERAQRRLQCLVLIRVKNELSEAQQRKLREIRATSSF